MKEDNYGAWPKTEEELLEYLRKKENGHHDYNSVAQALADVTAAMFNYFACKQGMTGFQCSWADMQFLKMTRGYEGPFGIIDGSKMLYPQYDLRKTVNEWLEEWKPVIANMAKEKLVNDTGFASESVVNHWKELAAYIK